MMKKFVLILLVLFFSSFVIAELSVGSGKYEYEKNEILRIDGNSSNNVFLNVYATNGDKKIFQGSINRDVNNSFLLELKSDCSFPSGEYRIDARSPDGTVTETIFIKNSRECAFLTVAFLSPSPRIYRRTESFDITVKVTDAGKLINNAQVFFWDLSGRQQRLVLKGNGIYSFDSYNIPFNSDLFEWPLMVTAIANTPVGTFGGENSVELELRNGILEIEIVNPKAREFAFGEPLEIIVKPKYPSNAQLIGGTARIRVEEKSFNLIENSPGEYSVILPTDDLNNAVLKIDFFAQDEIGNSGERSVALTPTGFWFWFLQRNAIFYIFPLLFVIYLVFLSYRQGRTSYKKISLEKKQKKLLELKKKLQDDYFNKSLISRQVYIEQSENLDSELDELEQKLQETKKKQEV